MDPYRENIIELYKNPLNKRIIRNADISHSGAIISCGDHVRIFAKVNKKGVITDASFEGKGCAISIAASSMLTEEAKGKTLAEIKKWNLKNIEKWLGVKLGPARAKCALLALESLQEGIKRFYKETRRRLMH